jgi:hypothetical protein
LEADVVTVNGDADAQGFAREALPGLFVPRNDRGEVLLERLI